MSQSYNWLIFAGILITGHVTSTQLVSSTVSGTCASIGYSTRCCPPSAGNECQATDGDCYCGTDCHIMGDCCEDIHCPSEPRICEDVGITKCCNDASGAGLCDVHYQDSGNNHCSCNVSCHRRGDCCPDAQRFCVPETCNDAGKYPKCCQRMDASSCYVPGGNCFCDPLCDEYHDCCEDALIHLSQCSSDVASQLSRSRLQAVQNHKKFNDRELRVHRQRANTNYAYQEAPAGRIQREYKEFRTRLHVARRPTT